MWKLIPSAPEYAATVEGTIVRVSPNRGAQVVHALKGWFYGKYLVVGMYGKPKVRKGYVHRLVAEAFLGACPEGLQVNHKDGNKLNNTPDNLEYVTPSENIRHAFATGLMPSFKGEGAGRHILTLEQVHALRDAYTQGASQRELAAEYGVSRSTIQFAVTGRNWGLPPVQRVCVSSYAPKSVKASVVGRGC